MAKNHLIKRYGSGLSIVKGEELSPDSYREKSEDLSLKLKENLFEDCSCIGK